MSEISKLYENCGIEIPIARLKIFEDDNGEIYAQPPFTAEEQIELIKWLAKRPLPLLIGQYKGKYYLGNSYFNSKADSFDDAIATRINDIWQSLTEEEKQQVKGILE